MKRIVQAAIAKALTNRHFSRLLVSTVVRLGRYVETQRALMHGEDDRVNSIYREFRAYTRVSECTYYANLRLVEQFRHVRGSVVECGVWRAGMIAGIARTLGPDRDYYLFDSFEGLPQAKEIDGEAALAWQAVNDVQNCRTEEAFAHEAMQLAGAVRTHVCQGWFDKTLKSFPPDEKIAILRLDADWYSSTAECLNNLYERVVPKGLIIVDDYYAWDGCARAIHDFLSQNKLRERIREFDNAVCYLVKAENRTIRGISPDQQHPIHYASAAEL